MHKSLLLATAVCFLCAPAVMAAPIPSVSGAIVSGDDASLVSTVAYHSHKNMKRVHRHHHRHLGK